MMDFLRSLAPASATDATRAVAVAPPRYGGGNPMPEPIGGADRDRAGEGEVVLPMDTLPLPARSGDAIRASTLVSIAQDRVSHGPRGIELAPGDDNDASTRAPAEPIGIRAPDPRSARDRHATARAFGALPESGLPRPEPAMPAHATSPSYASPGSPLSPSAVAQRIPLARGEDQVVHVSIGRIDVVANTAPAPAAQRKPAAHPASVTLADYLRGGSPGGRG